MPAADTYLAMEQPVPPNGYLHAAMPTEGLTIQAWSNFDPGNKFHAGGGILGGMEMLQVAVDEHGDNSAFYTGSTLSDVVGNGGVGKPETLPITASGTQIATMTMPPHMAFGIAAGLYDAAGKVIAIIATAQTSRPTGNSKSSVNVWGATPIAGQTPTAIGGISGYLWARAERKAFSNTFTIYDAANQVVALGKTISGFALQYKIETPAGQGLMLATFTPGSNKKSFDIQCAKGVDVTLAICMMAAMQVGRDELKVDKSQGGGETNAD